MFGKLQRSGAGLRTRGSRRDYRRLFETVEDGIFLLDAETGRILDVNASLLNLCGRTRPELLGRELWEADLFGDKARAQALFKSLQDAGYARFDDLPLTRRDGSVRHVELVSTIYPNDGGFVIQCNVRDAGERERLLREATTDFLTGLANRRHFEQALEQEFRRSVRYGHALSLVALDLDHFKEVNDSRGHLVGDAVLRTVAAAWASQLRSIDLMARTGGEEFCALLPETGAERAREVAERLRAATGKLEIRADSGAPLKVTVSIGVATLRHGDRSAAVLLERADRELYQAKRRGRNRVCG